MFLFIYSITNMKALLIVMVTCVIAWCTSPSVSPSSNSTSSGNSASSQPSVNNSVTTPDSADDWKVLALAKCLTDKGAVFYGTEWCSHCKNQKKLFGDAMSAVTFVDCDQQKDKCSQIQWYPTWVFADGSKAVGTQSLQALAQKVGCNF
jgi:hypothetical protein